MHFEKYEFGSIKINGITYDHDVVIDHGVVMKRKKKQSKKYRDSFGHTPLSLDEKIPWECKRLVIGAGMNSALPVMEEIIVESGRRDIELLILPTTEAIKTLEEGIEHTNAILHLTC